MSRRTSGAAPRWDPPESAQPPADCPAYFTSQNAVRVALAQLAAIMAGILGAAAGSKFVQVAGHDLPLPTAFMMTYGWVLLPLPLVWIIIAICVKDHPRVSESARRTCFALGVALLLGLCACAVFSSVAPWRQIGDAAPLAAPSPRPELP